MLSCGVRCEIFGYGQWGCGLNGEGVMAIICASCDMTAYELDNHMELSLKQPHGSVTEAYYALRFESVMVYLTPRQLDALHIAILNAKVDALVRS